MVDAAADRLDEAAAARVECLRTETEDEGVLPFDRRQSGWASRDCVRDQRVQEQPHGNHLPDQADPDGKVKVGPRAVSSEDHGRRAAQCQRQTAAVAER